MPKPTDPTTYDGGTVEDTTPGKGKPEKTPPGQDKTPPVEEPTPVPVGPTPLSLAPVTGDRPLPDFTKATPGHPDHPGKGKGRDKVRTKPGRVTAKVPRSTRPEKGRNTR